MALSTFDQLEESTEESRPVELYTFALFAQTFRFTSAEDTIVFGGNTFTPIAIGRDSSASGPDDRNRPLSIRMPSGNEFAQKYFNIPPGRRPSVMIQELQRDASPVTALLIFKGFVRSVQFPSTSEAEVSCLSLEAAGSHPLPLFVYQGQCNHLLYGPGCEVDPATHTLSSSVSGENGNVITVPGAGAFGGFEGGYVKFSGGADFRLVLKQSGDDLTILLPLPAPGAVGQMVEAVRGCDHLVGGDCKLVFANTARFGGFAWAPLKNPFTGPNGIA